LKLARKTATSAGAIILREFGGELKIALAHHKNSEKEWVLPKGHVEPDETIEQAALREIHEEAGLTKVQLINHLGTINRQSVKSNGDIEDKTIHYYLAYALGQEQSQSPTDQRFIEVGWFSPQKALELIPYETDRTFIKQHLAPMIHHKAGLPDPEAAGE
jgi:8-oxo-dGTP pyrophosphatase MutT (NUDIX family)